jgi:hypothetical protein
VETRVRTPLGLLGVIAGQGHNDGLSAIVRCQLRPSFVRQILVDLQRGESGTSAILAHASARARSRSLVACWHRRTAAGLLWPPGIMISAMLAPVAADQVSPECRTSWNRTYIAGLEAGRRNPSLDLMARLAIALRVDLAEPVGALQDRERRG